MRDVTAEGVGGDSLASLSHNQLDELEFGDWEEEEEKEEGEEEEEEEDRGADERGDTGEGQDSKEA